MKGIIIGDSCKHTCSNYWPIDVTNMALMLVRYELCLRAVTAYQYGTFLVLLFCFFFVFLFVCLFVCFFLLLLCTFSQKAVKQHEINLETQRIDSNSFKLVINV